MDKLAQRNLFQYTLSTLRETLIQYSGATSIARIKSGEAKFAQDFSKIMNVKKIDAISNLISDASYHLERNGSAKMIFLDLSLQIVKTIKS
jgi:DNA polymerase-3 subunit delta'